MILEEEKCENKKCKCKKCIIYRKECKTNKLEVVKKTFLEAGCELISEPFLTQKMEYKCSCGNINYITWHHFKNGGRCRKCGNLKSKKNNSKRTSVENKIHDYFKEYNCVLLEENYVNSDFKMRYICECGNESKITWDCFRTGHRCNNCAKIKIKNRFIPKKESHFRWNPNREEVALNKKIRNKAQHILKRSLLDQMKTDTTFNLLGYTKEELINHIKNCDNWESLKNSKWELDHIFPLKAFFDYKIYDVKKINILENLRPLSSLENKTKNSFYDKNEFECWLKSKDWL